MMIRCARCRDVSCSALRYRISYILTDGNRPLNPSELNVLKAQYEREGEMVGVQTKFNYAWVNFTRPNFQRLKLTYDRAS